jgi:hypothetical protein
MDGIADVGGVVGRSATYAFAREEPVLVERCGGPAHALALVCNRLTACSCSLDWLGALQGRLADRGSILADAATVRAHELSDRPTDTQHEH